jgi:hypothetical protein
LRIYKTALTSRVSQKHDTGELNKHVDKNPDDSC